MTEREFYDWAAFYEAFPFDDLHRFHRPAALIAANAGGGGIDERLDYLAPDRGRVDSDDFSDADLATMRAFGVKRIGG